MLKNRKYINDLKFKFFQSLLIWFKKNVSVRELETSFHTLIVQLGIPISQVIDCMEIKQDARGGFKKNLILTHVLINKEEKDLVQKYLLSSDNIFHGEVVFNQEPFYKFMTEKAVRDKVTSKSNICICHTETVNDKTFYAYLRKKLFEECKEILKAKNSIDLLEEIGDLYAIIKELEIRERLIHESEENVEL